MENKFVQHILFFIRQHIDQDLSLEILAKRACMSPFHFQRLFKEAVGETPKQYVTRIRLEKAAHQIVLQPEETILSLALECGYNSQESFSRAFKKFYSVSPDGFRKMTEEQKFALIQNKTHKQTSDIDFYALPHLFGHEFKEVDFEVKVEKRPPTKRIFIPSTLGKPEYIVASFKKIKQWAEVRELLTPNSELFGSFVDFPLFTALKQCRYLIGLSVDEKPALNGPIQFDEIPARTYASFDVSGDINKMLQRTTSFWKFWLPEHGYEIAYDASIHIPKLEISSVPFFENSFKLYISIKPS